MSDSGDGAVQGVSVIIPTYNRARCVLDAIRSAVEQDPPPLEVVVIDDGSTDNSGELIRDFGHPLVRYQWQENKGLSGARNAGLRLARGDLCALLDSDDTWLPGKLAAQERIMREDPECALVYTDMVETRFGELAHRSVLHEKGYQRLGEGYLYENLLHENFIIPSTVMLRTEDVRRVGYFDERLRSSEDRDMWLRLAETRKFRFVDQPLCMRNIDSDALTGDLDKWITNQLAMFREHLRLRRAEPLGGPYEGRGEAIVKRLEENVHLALTTLGQNCFRNFDLPRARRLLRESLGRRLDRHNLKYYLASHVPAPALRRLKRLKDARAAGREHA
ncbi:glycosyltransferase family 2 protein [Desulfohalovibrio reitneri]|uniref:glycosyltransferase family 2 protein n=1 Tax=Desulfohalovibrio reitneri TaxID=1307759 RepID=UPI00068E27D5|nr:glycosyltransferase family A protein [Desulfohalovibrio reitneri]